MTCWLQFYQSDSMTIIWYRVGFAIIHESYESHQLQTRSRRHKPYSMCIKYIKNENNIVIFSTSSGNQSTKIQLAIYLIRQNENSILLLHARWIVHLNVFVKIRPRQKKKMSSSDGNRTYCIIVLKNSVKVSRLDDRETAFARNRYYTVAIRGDSRKLRVHVARY